MTRTLPVEHHYAPLLSPSEIVCVLEPLRANGDKLNPAVESVIAA